MTWQDVTVRVEEGHLFARIWQPENKNEHTLEQAPIVLFHDSLGCVDLWRNFPALLSNSTQRQVIAYDRLGYGKSTPNPYKQSFDFISKESELYFPALRQQLNVTKFIAFGHSVGGAMAVHCASKFANSCDALITESAQAFVEDKTLNGIREAKLEFSQTSNIERLKKYHGEKAQWVLNAWIETWLSPEFGSWHLEDVLPQVQCPFLIIHGSEDEYGSNRHPEVMRKLASGKATMKILSGFNHVPHREQDKKVIELVVNFLDEELDEELD